MASDGRRGLRGRLIVAVVAVTTLTLGVALTLVAYAVNRSQEGQLDAALLAEAREEAEEASRLDGRHLDISDRPGPAPDDIGHLTKYAAIYVKEGDAPSLVATTATLTHAPAWSTLPRTDGVCFDIELHREHVRGVVVPVPRHPDTWLLLAAPRFDLDRDEVFMNRATALALLLSVLSTAGVAVWVVGRFTRGHEVIAAVARRVADGDLSARVDMHAGDAETRQLSTDVNQMIDRLSTLLSAQEEFVTHAAHELRSPLTTLLGELSHARRRSRDARDYEVAIDEALDSGLRLKAIAEDLLTLARATGRTDDVHERVDVRAVVEAAARGLQPDAKARAVTLHIDGQGYTRGRALMLERLFRNLLENAIRHSPKGGEVKVQLREVDGAVLVTTTDQGPGIPVAEHGRIFEPFYRGPNENALGLTGNGLGLAIARKIAGAHHGTVTLNEQRQSGAEFQVRLPGV